MQYTCLWSTEYEFVILPPDQSPAEWAKTATFPNREIAGGSIEGNVITFAFADGSIKEFYIRPQTFGVVYSVLA